jgi:hypothetical protein
MTRLSRFLRKLKLAFRLRAAVNQGDQQALRERGEVDGVDWTTDRER